MNEELISQIYSVKSSTVDHMKWLLEDVKNHKTQHLESRIKQLEKELKNIKKSKRYGLVWEDKPEDVVERCKSELPLLKEVTSCRISKTDDDLHHILIEGDNFHALSTLAYTHAGKIDVIYIDPPYNTGATDWKYNNNYVDGNDSYRHSKWLSFINNRLRIAKRLLKKDGVICLTIDDYELPNIWMLLNETFGEFNHLWTVKIRSNPVWRKVLKGISATSEYALFFGASEESACSFQYVPISEKRFKYKTDSLGHFLELNLRKPWKDSLAQKKDWTLSNRFFPIYLDEKTWEISVSKNLWIEIYPIDWNWEKRIWRRWKEVIEEMSLKWEIFWRKVKQDYQIYYKFRWNDNKEYEPYKDIWIDSKFASNMYWSQLISKIFGEKEKFDYPKSLYAVMECIKVGTNKKDSIILDFFAGSGTTGHAVLELNKEDWGKRQCILCTNNENQIAEEVTYPRIRNVIEGYADVEGIPANLRYYKTEFIGVEKSLDDLRYKFMGLCDELLCIKENTFEEVKLKGQSDELKLYKSSLRNMVILYDIHHFDACTKLLKTLETPTKVYIFSLAKEIYEEALSGIWKDIEIANIPDDILQTYKKIFHF